MKSIAKSETSRTLAFGAHPDDIEFGCGGVVAREMLAGRSVHFVICSRGESSTSGTPEKRVEEASRAAAILGATVEFVQLGGGDARFESSAANVMILAEVIRRVTPVVVLAPTVVENQHPDHAKLGSMVRDAARIARYGGVKELRQAKPHAIGQLLYFAVTPGAEPRDGCRLLVDVSHPKAMAMWKTAMEAHATQRQTRDYGELQLARARLFGLLAGVDHAIPLWAADDPLFDSLEPLTRGARNF